MPTLLGKVIEDSDFATKDNPTLLDSAAKDEVYDKIYKTLIGEAVGEGRQGMEFVYDVMLNQSEFFGKPLDFIVDNYYAASKRKDLDVFVSKQPRNLQEAAYDIITKSKRGMSKGALHFENIEAYGIPKYVKDEGGAILLMKKGSHTGFITLREYNILKKRGKLPKGLEKDIIKE